jgi:hypothetical protein
MDDDDDFPPREPEYQQEYTEEDNVRYVAFVKAYAPVLLHLARDTYNQEYKLIIEEFQELGEDAIPDADKTNTLRLWVDSVQEELGRLSPEDVARIIEEAKIQKLSDNSYHKHDYELCNKKRPNRNCAITMERIKPGEYYVDFLDNGNPYKVHAIIQYYKHMKSSNLDNRDEWKTPLRNEITKEQEEQLEDLIKWYDHDNTVNRKSTRSKRPRKSSKSSKSSKSPKSPKSPGKRRGGKRKTIRRNRNHRENSNT